MLHWKQFGQFSVDCCIFVGFVKVYWLFGRNECICMDVDTNAIAFLHEWYGKSNIVDNLPQRSCTSSRQLFGLEDQFGQQQFPE